MEAKDETSRKKGQLPPQRKMKLLASFDAGDLPDKSMRKFTKEVNALINLYNHSTKDDEKKKLLKQIQTKVRDVDYKYKPSQIAGSPGYRAVHDELFMEIKYQYNSLGVFSLIASTDTPSSLDELIANMAPDKANKLLDILLRERSSDTKLLAQELSKLYENETSEEAEAYNNFFRNHEVIPLGGLNSYNYKITGLLDESETVLKVENRLDMPRNIEAHLRGNLGGVFTKINTEREVTAVSTQGQTIHRTLIVTEYCKSGGLDGTRKTCISSEDLIEKTGDFFQQMTNAMLEIQEAGCMFPDAKITNWLVDETGKLRIADGKSFLFTDKNGTYSQDVPGNKYCGFLADKSFSPPEFFAGYPITADADAVHAYILGKNLYYYATGTLGVDVDRLDFSGDFFTLPRGSEYKELIQELMNPDPDKRLSIKEAANRIFVIHNPEFENIFIALNELKFGENDREMNKFIHEKQQLINKTKDPEARSKILQDLTSTVTQLKTNQEVVAIRGMIDQYRKTVKFYTIGKNAKALRIERAMSKLPIEDRCNFNNSSNTKEVLSSIASHRKIKIGSDKLSKSFIEFKKLNNAQRESRDGQEKKDRHDSPLPSITSK